MNAPFTSQYIQSLQRLAELNLKTTQTKDLETTLFSMTELACDITNCNYSFILVIDHETGFLKFVAGPLNLKDRFAKVRIPTDSSIAGAVYNTGQKIVMHQPQYDERLRAEFENILGFQVKNMVAMPLTFQGETIGVLEVINKRDSIKFSKEDLALLESLAAQAGIAIMSNLLFSEVKSAFQQVDELERLKTNFIAITSHELRTPLGLILGHATYLNETSNDETVKQQVDVIIRSANRLREIIEDLSKVSNFQSKSSFLRHRLLSMNDLIKAVVGKYIDTASEKQVKLLAAYPDDSLMVEGDEEKLLLAINNLVNNAITFTDNGGSVQIRLEQVAGQVQISVEDTGIGIPAADLPRIFERFFQVQSHLTRRHGGMGLGLTVAKAMVDLHKGHLTAESVEGQGSKFTITLPPAQVKTKSASPDEVEQV